MRRIWLLFAQTVTVCLGVLFVLVTLRPDWLGRATTKQASPPLALNTNVDPSKLSKESERMARSFNAPTSFANGVAAATPGVVNIFTTKHVAVSRLPLPADPFIRKFFEQMPGFSERRHILTNFHVIDGAEEILVALSDGRQANAKVIGVDPETDLGVLKIELPDLHVLPFATQETLRVGDVVLAIGNPFGVGQTTTMGIVSALGRDGLGINVYENFIQTDAAINPGNSGGALIDTQGKLVGINTAIYSQSGGSLGIGFAIPASAALRVMDQIIKEGRVKRGWLGIEPQDMTAELARAFGVEQAQGAIVAGIVRDGPAMIAGLQVGDIIQHLDGRKVEDANRLLGRIAALLPGKTVKLDVVRKAQHQDITVTLGTKPPINR